MKHNEEFVRDLIALLRADSELRDTVLEGLEGTDPRLPDLSANRAACEALRKQGNPNGSLLGLPRSGRLKR